MKGWYLYVVVCVLLFVFGMGFVCKGVVLDFVDFEEWVDVLSVIVLVEKIGECL